MERTLALIRSWLEETKENRNDDGDLGEFGSAG